MATASAFQRATFWEKVDRSGGPTACWPWLANRKVNRRTGEKTYGLIGIGPKGKRSSVNAHHLAYEIANGEIPAGQVVRHRCDNPGCCNPAHLELGTQLQNIRDRVERGRSATNERHGKARLTATDVLAIRAVAAASKRTPLKALSRHYGVAKTTIAAAIRGDTWRGI